MFRKDGPDPFPFKSISGNLNSRVVLQAVSFSLSVDLFSKAHIYKRVVLLLLLLCVGASRCFAFTGNG